MSINYIKSIKSTHRKPVALAFSSLTQQAEGQSLLYRQIGIWGFFVIKNWPVWINRIAFSHITGLCSIALITVAWRAWHWQKYIYHRLPTDQNGETSLSIVGFQFVYDWASIGAFFSLQNDKIVWVYFL